MTLGILLSSSFLLLLFVLFHSSFFNLIFYGLDPCHYFQFSWIKLGCYVKNDWCKIRKKYQILTSTYLLKKDWEEEFLTLLKDMLKQITNT